MRTGLIQKQATFLVAVLAVYTVIYAYVGLGGLLNFSFIDPQLMINSKFTGGQTSTAMRWQHFFAWLPANVAGLYACGAAIYVSSLARSGRFFTNSFAKGLMQVGYAVILSAIADLVGAALVPHILSALNPAGQVPIEFQFSSHRMGLVLCGIGFTALGKMMAEATRLSEENKGFV